ncbi:MAG: hypothetical protein ABL958_03465 [Bdellovibrionia bacterium]
MKRFANVFLALFLSQPLMAQTEGAPKSRGNAFNPDIGLNALFLYRSSTRGNDPASNPKNGFGVEEGELQFASDVDPYFRAVGLLAFAEDPINGWEIEPEELYGETLGLSLLTLKFGKFKALVNKHNILHAHAYPFTDAPLVNTELLGDEGVNEAGISISALLPTSWFLELTLQAMSGENTLLFAHPEPNKNASVAYLDNLFDLTEDLTLQLGGSYTMGQNAALGWSRVVGGDLTVKWKPVGNDSIRTLKWANHYLSGDQDADPLPSVRKQGITSFLQWQGGQRWWLQARTEYYTKYDGGDLMEVKRKNSALYAFTPSEFSAVRFQLDQLEDGLEPIERRFLVQLNLSIGAHPAHQY